MVTPELILAFIKGTPRQQATMKQLLRELHVRGEERSRLRGALTALVREHRLTERRRVFALAAPPSRGRTAATRGRSAPLAPPGRTATARTRPEPGAHAAARGDVTGHLSLHRDGYGFVTPDSGGNDVFIPPKAIHGAMHGDEVAVRVHPRPDYRRAAPADAEERRDGEITAVLRRRHTTLVGIFHADPRGNTVQPIDSRIRDRVLIPPGGEAPPAAAEPNPHRVLDASVHAAHWPQRAAEMNGLAVEIEVTSFASATAAARGRVIDVLGQRDDFGVDVEIVIRKHHLRHRFPPEVLEEARRLSGALPEDELAGRRDFREFPIVTIDGESARDFDDAVYVHRQPDGHYELQVHIADVAAYVPPGSALDQEARLRGTSVYFPDRAVPMLPAELSTGLCSLRPHEDRLTLSCVMTISPQGEVQRYTLQPGIIRSAARMTYTQVNAVLEGDDDARERFAALAPHFACMAELQAILYDRRRRRGSIDFDLPEPEIAFDELGLMQSIVKSERNTAHRLIEEFMLAAAETVARHLEASGWASVYRIHEPPDLKKIAEFEEIAGSFGYSLGLGALPIERVRVHGRVVEVPQPGQFRIHPRNYQALTERIAGKPEERMLSYLMLRSLKQARYSAANPGHFALATACYTHFTSPIRRYPDLLVHRLLKALLAGAPPPPSLASAEQLEPLCREASEAERTADDAEHELMDWKKVRFMERRLGETFPALIVHVTRYGFYVELNDLFIEGFVPATSLEDDEYRYRDSDHAWVGQRSKRRYRLGAAVEVIADRIDPVRQEIHFAPALPAPARHTATAPHRRNPAEKKTGGRHSSH